MRFSLNNISIFTISCSFIFLPGYSQISITRSEAEAEAAASASQGISSTSTISTLTSPSPIVPPNALTLSTPSNTMGNTTTMGVLTTGDDVADTLHTLTLSSSLPSNCSSMIIPSQTVLNQFNSSCNTASPFSSTVVTGGQILPSSIPSFCSSSCSSAFNSWWSTVSGK